MNRKHFLRSAGALAALACLGGTSAALAADAFPSKPIRIVIPSVPGGGTDFIGRTLAQRMAEATGWNFVPDNRPGAAGTLGLGETVRSGADGHEIVIGQTANVSLAPWLMKLSFDPIKDLTPIALAVESPQVLLVNGNSPHKTWADFVKAAKAAPDKPMNFGTSGIGSVGQVAGEKVQELDKVKWQHVPYKGSTPAIADLIGNQLDVVAASLASSLGHVQGGKVRALAITSKTRSASMPDVPTLAELGYTGFNIVEWYGVFGPAKLPAETADKLHDTINQVLQREDVRKAIVAQGQDPKPISRAEFASMVKADNEASREIIAKAGIKLE